MSSEQPVVWCDLLYITANCSWVGRWLGYVLIVLFKKRILIDLAWKIVASLLSGVSELYSTPFLPRSIHVYISLKVMLVHIRLSLLTTKFHHCPPSPSSLKS